jgi:hypothetical protein
VELFERQLLDRQVYTDVAEVVEAVAGLNAQTARGPSVGLWVRMTDFRQQDLDEALGGYRLVKANLMRGTVHMVTQRQYASWRRALQPALRPAVNQFCRGMLRQVDEDRLVREGIAVLADHDGLHRGEIGERLAPLFQGAEPRQLGFAIRMLAPVVQVADLSVWTPARTRYVLASTIMDEDFRNPADGLKDLLGCYLRAFGPATAADAVYWSGLTGLNKPLAATFQTVLAARTGSRTFDAPVSTAAARAAFVLPEYDNIFFCNRSTSADLNVAKKRLIFSPSAGMYGAVVDGVSVSAQWRRIAGTSTLQLQPWGPLSDAAALEFESFRTWYAAVSRSRDSRE